MSVTQYQKIVNDLDKEITNLEKKKAELDKKAAYEQGRAAKVSISSNISISTLKSKQKEIERYESASRKAAQESAEVQKKIADKREKRNNAYLKLQKEEQQERKREQQIQKRVINDIRQLYESRIAELEEQSKPIIKQAVINNSEEYDVFVSHAWEDKASFVDEFVDELKKADIKVWYDTSQIKWGDSLRKRIDDGLKKSRFGIVVLSPNYIAEGKYWTKTELDGLFQMESINGKVILPIWHNLTKQQVMDFSPIIAGKDALTTALMTAKEMAEEFVKLISDEEEIDNGQNENGNA